MANPTTYFGWVMPTTTDLVTDLPADFNVFGQGVDTSMQGLLGGTTGQVLSKTSGTNMAFTWVTPTDQTPLTTKGDLFTFSTVDARLGVGTNGQVLMADSTASTGLKWAASGGKVLQIVSTTKTDTFTSSSTSAVDITGLSVSITPSLNTSKIMVLVTVNGNGQGASNGASFVLLRDATQIAYPASPGSRSAGFGGIYINDLAQIGTTGISHLDSPATTSAITYKVQGFCATSGSFVVNRSNTDTNSAGYVRTVSSITVMEIGA